MLKATRTVTLVGGDRAVDRATPRPVEAVPLRMRMAAWAQEVPREVEPVEAQEEVHAMPEEGPNNSVWLVVRERVEAEAVIVRVGRCWGSPVWRRNGRIWRHG